MQNTPNYNLNLPEGTDVVNPLVDYNPNFTVIDGAMKSNADRTVGRATCVKSGTTHAITRSNTGSNIINFTATGDWVTGDTMTVDGTLVSVYLPNGTAPLTGAYVINTEVFAVINGSRVTLYGAQKRPDYNASDINYDNTGSSLTASNVQGAIDEVVAEIAKASLKRATVSGTTDALGNLTTAIPINNANIIGARYGSAQNGGVIPMISPVSDVWYFKCLDERMQEVANSNVIVYYWYI